MKLLKLYLVILVAFACNCTNSFGQEYNKVMPSSPQAYSFGQYVDVPVGNATGVPDISVPLYTIGEGKASLPISLSYHASGIKVEQEATWVGLGWTLNAGGMISRSKLGIPDKIGGRGADPLLNRNQYSGSDAKLYYELMFWKSKDSEHDIFYYNFLGYSGKFVLDDLGNPVLLETTNIKIIPIGTTGYEPDGWELIVEDGTKCFFGEATGQIGFIEKFASFTPNDGYTSGWHLREIQYVNGQKIKFTYADEEVRSLSSMVKVMQEYWVYPPAGEIKDKYRYEDVAFSTKRVTSIESDNTKVIFDAEKLRFDLPSTNSYALTKMRILDKNNLLTKSFEFTSSYFQNSESDDYKIKRLRLDEIKELSTNGLTGQHWKLYYNSLMLPSKGSCAQDLFGYYNGETGNTSLVPRINETVSASDYNPGYYGICGFSGLSAVVVNVGEANREPNENSMKACLIESIVHPTGGSTKYVFEPNSYNFIGNQEISSSKIGGGLRIAEIKSYFADNSYLKTIYTYKILGTDGVTETNKSSGVLNNNPRFYSFRATATSVCSLEWGAPILVVSATPTNRLALTHGSPVGYQQVKVQKISGTTNNGCEVYEYSSGYEHPDIFNYFYPGYSLQLALSSEYVYGQGVCGACSFDQLFCNMAGMQGSISYEPLRGLLNRKSIYNSSNLPVNSTTYSYSSKRTFLYNDYPYIQQATRFAENCRPVTFGFSFKVTPVSNCTNQLMGVYNYNYLNGGTVYTHKDYTYNHNQVIKEVSTDSKGNEIIKKYKYPLDYNSGVDAVIDNLKSDAIHILSPAIEEQEWLKQDNSYKLTKGAVTTYGSNYMPQKIYTLETSNPLSSSLFGEEFEFTGPYQKLFPDNNSYYKEKVTLSYTNSDVKKLCTVLKKDDIAISYLWGYNNTQPIAKVENATYEQVKTALGVDPATIAASTTPDMTKVDGLRTTLPNALVTTYTYKPLVGITSVTDPRGVTTNYTYDTFNRLYLARNDDKNVIGRYSYGYQNAPDNGQGGYTAPVATVTTGATSYTPGATGSASLGAVSGGSGNYTYNWYLKNSSKTILASNENSTSTSFSYTCSQTGTLTVQCRIADNQTGLVNTASAQITVNTVSEVGIITLNSSYVATTYTLMKNGTSAGGFFVFYPTTTMSSYQSYIVGKVSSNCKPSSMQNYTCSNGGRTWYVNIDTTGNIVITLVGGTPLPAYSTSVINFSYNL